ncbi:efflux RND transporter periplasmic adaptor subunit [Acetobacterium bakii]|uniref:YknX-like beta-barrel domain-containing protein n=1 Tax=Acetobacterium bakii TaxID=52689 RepID=A0A0L6TW61_9FIRM|nr:efflux RND transporter periplasmic adaptor subunit [Acetobacterium bakii]KNZ40504.1 hypothetical protein AKG39_17270 [Acetobacterium bakii]
MKKKKLIIGIIIGVVVLVGGGLVFANGQKTDILSVKTTPLAMGNLQNTISATGVVESNTLVNISDSSNDNIDRIYVSVGEWVGNGDWLCELYNKDTDTYTNIKAKGSGTITTINAKKDTPANGILFVIQNTDDLQIKGKVKEADVNSLKNNMTVMVKSDATGDKVFQGNLTMIAPTAISSDTKTESTTKNAEFAIEVDLTGDITGLKIGMNTRLNIVSAEKKDVFTVPFDVLVSDGNGAQSIYIAKENPDTPGSFSVESIPVTTGMETDSQIEISGDQLISGMPVIAQPQTVTPGTAVTLEEGLVV